MTDAITRPLAALMAALHPGWDAPGCAAAIHKARHLAPPDQLAHAAIDLAMRADLRTPDTRVEPARCTVPGHEHELAHACRACVGDRMAEMAPDGDDTLTLSTAQAEINELGAARVLAALSPNGTI